MGGVYHSTPKVFMVLYRVTSGVNIMVVIKEEKYYINMVEDIMVDKYWERLI